MTLEDIKDKAIESVEVDNPNSTGFKTKLYEHFMDGTLVRVSFKDSSGKEGTNHVHFGRDGVRLYRSRDEILSVVANYKERNWFFRFLEMAGIGGVIAFILVVIFSVLLSILAFSQTQNNSVVDVIKLSFTIILGYFFGQATNNRGKT